MVRVIKRKAVGVPENFSSSEKRSVSGSLQTGSAAVCYGMSGFPAHRSPQPSSEPNLRRRPAHVQRRQLFLVLTILLASAVTRAIGDEKAASLPADPCRIEVLNNLVSELMDAGKRGLLGRRRSRSSTRARGGASSRQQATWP